MPLKLTSNLNFTPSLCRALAVALTLTSCAVLPALAERADRESNSPTVAEVGSLTLTQADLEAVAAAELRQLEQQRHKILETNLDRLVEQNLIRLEAEKSDQTPEAWLQARIEAGMKPVTDADVDAWYEANQERVNQPKDRVIDQIRAFLGNQRASEAHQEVMAELRERYPVRVHFEPLRVDVSDAAAPTKGPDNAPVELVIFSDFQCPYCKSINPVLEQLNDSYGDKLSVTFRQFPLRQIHPDAQKAAEASLCAAEQDKFWPMHDAMFAKADDLSVATLKAHAGTLGLDGSRFAECLDSGVMVERVQQDFQAGQEAGVPGTPAMYVNGRAVQLVRGTPPEEVIGKLIDDELARQGS